MATFLDMAFVGKFSIIFTFLLVFVLVYALLELSGLFGKERRSLSALLALAIGVMVIVSPTMTTFVHFIIPWLFAFILIAFFILFIAKIFGGEDTNFASDTQGAKRTKTIVIVIIIVLVIFGLGKSLGDQTLQEGNWDGTSEVVSTSETNLDGEYVYVDDQGNVIEITKTTSSSTTTTSGGSGVATDDYSTNLINTLFNPKVLGFILVMLIGAFAMFFLAD